MLELLPLVMFLLLLLQVRGSSQGPIRALAIAWLVCLMPIAAGVVRYGYAGGLGLTYPAAVIGFLACFVFGALLHEISASNRPVMPQPVCRWLAERDFGDTLPIAYLCWWLATAGTVFICLDFYLFGGAGLNDIAALRDAYLGRDVSILAKLGSVLTWACLYCFGFALAHRPRLGHVRFARFMLPVLGYFLVAVFSAGRQTAFQIMIFTVILLWINRLRAGQLRAERGRGALFAVVVSAAMIAYMGYVAVSRNDALISEDKVEVLVRIFDLEFLPIFDHAVAVFGQGVRATVVEGMVYFSSSVTLFEKFLELDLPGPYFGAMSFPFVFRQLEPLTGISVIGAYLDKVDAMQSLGVTGVAWTTAISSYMLDFGVVGACLLLIAQGYYSSFVWRRAIEGACFHDAMIAAVAVAAAVYLPLLAATSDTNLLLVWVFCIFARNWNIWVGSRLRERVGALVRSMRDSQ